MGLFLAAIGRLGFDVAEVRFGFRWRRGVQRIMPNIAYPLAARAAHGKCVKSDKKSKSRGKFGPWIPIFRLLRYLLRWRGIVQFEKCLVRDEVPILPLASLPARPPEFPLDSKKLAEIGFRLCAEDKKPSRTARGAYAHGSLKAQ